MGTGTVCWYLVNLHGFGRARLPPREQLLMRNGITTARGRLQEGLPTPD